MNEQWTGDIVGKLHNHKIKIKEFAEFMSVTEQWVSAILNGKRSAKGSEEKFNAALDDLIAAKAAAEKASASN